MAISYSKYAIANWDNACAAIKTAVEATGFYDTVQYTGGHLTLHNVGNKYLDMYHDGGTVAVLFYTDNIGGTAKSSSSSSNTYLSVATSGGKVMVTFFGRWRISFILAQSSNGLNIIVASGDVGGNYQPWCIPSDATDIEAGNVTGVAPVYSSSAPIAILAGLVGISESESFAVPVGVYRFARIPSSIRLAYTNDATNDCTQFQVNGKSYITDGFFCVEDS